MWPQPDDVAATALCCCKKCSLSCVRLGRAVSDMRGADCAGEVLEVVSESGEVIAHAARTEVHTRGLLHRAVYCLVFDTRGRLLLQQRSPQCAPCLPATPTADLSPSGA